MDDVGRIAKLLDDAAKAPPPRYCDTEEKVRYNLGYEIGNALESVLGGDYARIGAALLDLLRQGRDLSASASIAPYLRRAPALTSADVQRLLEQVDKAQPP
ncbi:MAG TPA: hypothetical protein VN903_16600 [Polyangia bacterium]|nr:hypothetical protein [Polyangia bacterium]